ncbi:hypothetical protein RIF29_15668 [Crotalaria pallida]|uniref:Uncharacterized protein n=1 Tax=Crotalaria pallida TaxID=3830 RepID=A0AAN9FDI5_CROPI
MPHNKESRQGSLLGFSEEGSKERQLEERDQSYGWEPVDTAQKLELGEAGGERRVAWKKLARKNVHTSPPKSPNSGLKRKDVHFPSDDIRPGGVGQGETQKLRKGNDAAHLMAKLMEQESVDRVWFDVPPTFLTSSVEQL